MNKYSLKDLLNIKKDKPAVRVINKFVSGEEIDEIMLTKSLSSLITHGLIEIEHSESYEEAQSKHEGYHLEDLALSLYCFMAGNLDMEEIRLRLEGMLNES